MTRAGRIEERLADRLDKYRRGAAKESLPGGRISAAKILPRISPRLLNHDGQNPAENLAEIPNSRRPKSCREKSPAENISQGRYCFHSDEC